VNDLAAALLFDGAPTQEVLEDRAELFAEHAPDGVSHVRGLLRRSWLLALVWNSLQHLSQVIFTWRSEQDVPIGASLSGRAAGRVLPLPDLRLALAEYAQRVRTLEQQCRQYHRRCVFLTQPTIWRAGLSAAEQSLLYSGGVGYHGIARGYVSAPELERAMAAYNQVLLAVCREDQFECYDMAAAIPKDTSAFSDESHYNDHGTHLVADYLAERLLASPSQWNQRGSIGSWRWCRLLRSVVPAVAPVSPIFSALRPNSTIRVLSACSFSPNFANGWRSSARNRSAS
jgi:hypothetical protein